MDRREQPAPGVEKGLAGGKPEIVVEPFEQFDGQYSYKRWRVRDRFTKGQAGFFADFGLEQDAFNYRDMLQGRGDRLNLTMDFPQDNVVTLSIYQDGTRDKV